MAINDDWNYTRSADQLGYTVYDVNLATGEAEARASFVGPNEAQSYAETEIPGRGWGTAVEDAKGFVTWTSF